GGGGCKLYGGGGVGYFPPPGHLLSTRPPPPQFSHPPPHHPLFQKKKSQNPSPAGLQRVILRCLEKDPDHRYQDALSLDKAFAACACAGRWTLECAEDWWRQHGGTKPASSLEALQRDSRTLPAGS